MPLHFIKTVGRIHQWFLRSRCYVVLSRLPQRHLEVSYSCSFSTEATSYSKHSGEKQIQAPSNDTIQENLTVLGWVQSIRRHKTRIFFELADGSSPFNLQVVAVPNEVVNNLRVGSAVSIVGNLVQSYKVNENLVRGDLHAQSICVLDTKDRTATITSEGVQGVKTPRPNLGLLRSTGLSWRHRLPELAAMFRLRASVKQMARDVMNHLGYLEVDPPILTTTDCEGAGQSFAIQSLQNIGVDSLKTKDSSDAVTTLTGSAQLHLEALALGLSKVYTLNPTFRAETSHTRNHLAEFYMLEAESVHLETSDRLCTEIEVITQTLVQRFLDKFSLNQDNFLEENMSAKSSTVVDNADFLLINSILTEDHDRRARESNAREAVRAQLSLLESSIGQSFQRMTFTEACAHLGRSTENSTDLTKDEERQILEWVGNQRPVFITHFPCDLKPFYCSSTDGVHAEAVDLLVPGVGELVGGSVRETNASSLVQRITSKGMNPNTLDWYVNLRGHGSAPHGGFGLGFERLLQFLTGVRNIRDVIPFPRTADKIVL